ncbi:hypothetical protein EB796_004460 [Bugula neritina]|uniref:Uncharacterized protein n=1 Tax=Bugula neritina TaxID=10212 RepID=A0A7J7KH64_BUGNE|nr:hypothetical protein EB796_004460 [Bugula neritina]
MSMTMSKSMKVNAILLMLIELHYHYDYHYDYMEKTKAVLSQLQHSSRLAGFILHNSFHTQNVKHHPS